MSEWPWAGPLWLALVAYGAVLLQPDRTGRRLSWSGEGPLLLAWVLHGAAVALQISGGQGPWRFGFAPALSATLWLVLGVYLFERALQLAPWVRRVLAMSASVSLVLMWLFPGWPHEPVAGGAAAWAPLHWILGMASYGVFGAAALHALWMRQWDQRLRNPRRLDLDDDAPPLAPRSGPLSLMAIEALTFRLVAAGFVVLTLALVLGALATPTWHWDHKVVLSLLSWSVFAGLLLGRHFLGWRGMQAVRWLLSGVLLLLLAYVGSRFVFQVLLQRAVPPL